MTAFLINANLAFDNYSELITSIGDWLDRDDLAGKVPEFIALAEDKIRTRVEPYFLETTTTLTTDATTGVAALPSDFKQIKRVLYDGEAVYQRGTTAISDVTDDTTRPYAFTLEQGALRVWPAAAHSIQVLYQPLLPRLTNGNPTNNLLDLFPSLYFFGAMVFALGYLEDDERAAAFNIAFESALVEAADYYKAQRQSGPMVPRVPYTP